MSNQTDEIVGVASPHTIKKFELIEEYTKAWAHKLLEYGRQDGRCKGLVFIDCMSSSGLYVSETTHATIYGTPIRVAKALSEIMREKNYQNQHAYLYFNDLSGAKIATLKEYLPPNTRNFTIYTTVGDGNELLRIIGPQLSQVRKLHYLLIYDPYQATIDWKALYPFLNNWGELIINHMVSDSLRAVAQARRPETISKYESTYLTAIEELILFGSDRRAFENRIKEIIMDLREYDRNRYYIASFPFFNRCNTVVYNLIHCTGSNVGFDLFKRTAWKVFGGRSSSRRSKADPNQIAFDLDGDNSDDSGALTTAEADEDCYCIQDIAHYLLHKFSGRQNVAKNCLWMDLKEHPVFPSQAYRNQICDCLRDLGCKIHTQTVDFI